MNFLIHTEGVQYSTGKSNTLVLLYKKKASINIHIRKTLFEDILKRYYIFFACSLMAGQKGSFLNYFCGTSSFHSWRATDCFWLWEREKWNRDYYSKLNIHYLFVYTCIHTEESFYTQGTIKSSKIIVMQKLHTDIFMSFKDGTYFSQRFIPYCWIDHIGLLLFLHFIHSLCNFFEVKWTVLNWFSPVNITAAI